MRRAPDHVPGGFLLVNRWTVAASCEAAFDALTDGSILDWWSDVYLAAEDITPGDAAGIGRRVALVTKGALPYRIRWCAQTVALQRPTRIAIAATGDLVGEGVWSLEETAGLTRLGYRWHVAVEAPWMKRALPVLRPVFAWNHNWAMRRGEVGLRGHLAKAA